MGINTHKNSSFLKKKIRALETMVEREPVMLFSDSGKIWISDKARNKLAEKKINAGEIIEWLQICIRHLKMASYRGLDTLMMRLPDNPRGSEVLIVLRDNGTKDIPLLTSMEKKVMKFLVKGLSNKGIASSLNIRPGTVNAHLDNIYRKLNVSNRCAAICTALKSGIIVPSA